MTTRNDTDQVFVNGVAQSSSPVVRDVTSETNYSVLQSRAQGAIAANATYLAIASPTNAQVAAQVTLLTKENNALIRLLLGVLDSTAGT